jgi:Tfp pilus assembly protein PilO
VRKWLEPRLRWPDAQQEGRRVLKILGVAAAANLVVFLLLTEPLHRLSRVRLAEWQAMEQRLEQRRRSVERLQLQVERLERQSANLAQFYDAILADKVSRMTAIQRGIRMLSTQFNVNPESVSYGPTYLPVADLVQFDVSFPLRGSYESLRQFVQRVESSEHFLVIDDISLADSREGGVSLNLNVRLHTYFRDLEFRPDKKERG